MLKETMDYKVKMIEDVLGIKFTGQPEELEKFINDHDAMLKQAIDNNLSFMNRIVNTKVFRLSSEKMEVEDFVVADTEEDALKEYVTTVEAAMIEVPDDLTVEEMDKYEDYLEIHESLVPEGDVHLWTRFEEDGHVPYVTYDVQLIYIIDYYLTSTKQSIPVILI